MPLLGPTWIQINEVIVEVFPVKADSQFLNVLNFLADGAPAFLRRLHLCILCLNRVQESGSLRFLLCHRLFQIGQIRLLTLFLQRTGHRLD